MTNLAVFIVGVLVGSTLSLWAVVCALLERREAE